RTKLVETQRGHDFDLILRHRPESIARVILAARRCFGIAVPPQIRTDNGEFTRQHRRNPSPGQMGKWITVHQEHRRPAAAGNGDDAGTAGFDFGSAEAFEHWHDLTYWAVMAGAGPAIHVLRRENL